MTFNRTPYFIPVSFVLLLLSNCQNNNADSFVAASSKRDSISKPKTSVTKKSDHIEIPLDTGKLVASVKLIEGTYEVINDLEESDQCTMTIIIQKATSGFTYKFITETRSLSGKVSVEATERKD